MRKCTVFFMLIFCSIFIKSNAQKIGNYLPEYLDHYKPEKLHLHFDKSIYNKGETIWFKSYLLVGNGPSDFSRNFYVDWYDQNGQLLSHTIHPIFESSARGMFDIPANYKGEKIHLKAYTQWMLNYDSSFVYIKDIPVMQTDTANKAKSVLPVASIQFFPEGGDLINGVNSNVGFIVTNQSGKPVTVRGAIFNNTNQLVDSFLTIHEGMGKFSIEPSAKETYYCNWIDEYGISHTSNLPIAKPSGVALETKLKQTKAVFVLKRSTELSDNFKSVHIIATINQQVVFNAAANLSSKRIVIGEFPVDSLNTGILQITLFDANWLPIAERIQFVKNTEYEFFPSVQVINKRLIKRGKNTLEIIVPDTVLSNLSVSITDAGLYSDNSSNIISQLLLSNEIKGNIYHPAYYFEKDTDEVNEQLDLVMMTHGWRRYKWDEIAKGKLPTITYPMDSDYLQIKGTIITPSAPMNYKANPSITLVMQAKDSSKQYFNVPIKPDGSFRQRGIIFFDTTKVYYQINGDKKLNDVATVNYQYSLPVTAFARAMRVSNFHVVDSVQLRQTNLFYNGVARTRKTMDSTVILKEVTVNSKVKSNVDVLDEKYTTGLFNSKNGYSFDVMNDDRAKGSLDVFHYLQDMIPGMTMSIPILGANGAQDANSSNVPGLNWRDGSPDLFINEIPSDAGAIMELSMSEVAYIKVFRPPFMAASGSGASGAIVIYTKKGQDIKTDNVKGLRYTLVSGYSNYREFYQPDYSTLQSKYTDARSTLYWNPYILTDKKNKSVKFDFYNNDVSTRFRVIVEGVNANGKLARIEKIIE
ncbi:MAG: hypothetical protein NTZ19_04605 [Bacteroidetes bacterium]|nr:hypothetical protein [Bacteroidota bacterium]